MTWYEILLTLHILAVITWLGGAVAGVLIGARLRPIGDATGMARFCEAFAQIGGPLFGGSAVLVLATGIAMVAREGFPGFDAIFVSVGFAGWLVSMVLGATVVGRTWYRVGEGLGKEGATVSEFGPLIGRAIRLTWLDIAIRTAVVVVMVWQPV